MGAFNKKAILNASPALIPAMADRICQTFAADGYEIKRENLVSGGVDISVTKGGFFKAVLGMKTALKITLVPQNNAIDFEAGVGIFGQQAIPTIIMLFFAWPVVITQIWGLVQQSSLDDKALAAAQSVINENGGNAYAYGSVPPPMPGAGNPMNNTATSGNMRFCTNCGTPLPDGARFCSNCGNPVN